jgi:hypothetical protein
MPDIIAQCHNQLQQQQDCLLSIIQPQAHVFLNI